MENLNKHRISSSRIKANEEKVLNEMLGTTRSNEPLQAVVENQLNESALNEQDNNVLERNRALLQYTATVAKSNSTKDEFNYEFVESLVKGGADINIADQHGQTIFHEVARSWNTDTAHFLIQLGGDVNKQDNFGRSPLHVAAAVDYVEMTEFLLVNNANIDSKTSGECQAPIHYAAKNGATRSLKMLLSFDANIDTLDAKQRTPLQVAAEWSRGRAAKILIAEGAASCLLDITGNSALCVLISNLPNLAVEALNQLHTTDVITLREYFYLQHLEASRQKVETKTARTALETAVANVRYEVITHPVMCRLVHNKWECFGWFSTTYNLLFHVIFGIAWTVFCLGTPRNGKDLYNKQVDRVWKITLGAFILLMTLYDIGRHIQATFKSRKSQRNWIKWKMEQLEYDLKYCHPRWPQEQKFVKNEMKRVHSLPLFDSYDAWFYMDWIILVSIVATIVTHFVFLYIDTSATWYLYTRTISIMNLLVWLRLLKFVRPFRGIGTLVIILSETLGDFINWAFLFFLILVPFAASFWINFGPLSEHPVHGYHTTGELLYRVFQIAVGDEFNLEEIVEVDPSTARILVVLYVTAMTIVTLNLLIALLSDTFGRVHSNAVANTIMQRAVKIVESERTLTKKQKSRYKEYMEKNCSPEIIKMQVASWDSNKKSRVIEKEMCDEVVDMKNVLDDRFGKIYGKDKSSDFDGLIKDLRNVRNHEDNMANDLEEIEKMLRIQTPGKSLQFRQVNIKTPDSTGKRKGRRRSNKSLSLEKQDSKGFVSTLQEMLPRWLRGEMEGSPKGRRQRQRPRSTPQSQNREVKERRHRQSRRRNDATENAHKDEHQPQGTGLRRRGRRKTRNTETNVEGHVNPSYDPDLAWDTVSIDSSPV